MNLSDTDRRLSNWFTSDHSKRLLRALYVSQGNFRSLSEGFRVDFDFPITAICGRNGSGKSTLLALAACTFHHERQTYFTFKDFFVSAPGEPAFEGVAVGAQIAHNAWRPSPRVPKGTGLGFRFQSKQVGGRWTNYKQRIKRRVLYLGLDRIVPPYERSAARSYISRLRTLPTAAWQADLENCVSHVLNRQLKVLEIRRYKGYEIFIVEYEQRTTSSYNLGAGESSLLSVFAAILSCDDNPLIVIDEIELGLHPEAQTRFVEQLKRLCLTKKFQILCSTHSPQILEALPESARILLEKRASGVIPIKGISPAYAFSHLAGSGATAIDVLVEDEIAQKLLENALPLDIRKHINIVPIGSWSVISRYLGGRYRVNEQRECVVILDGDQRTNPSVLSEFKKSVEDQSKLNAANAWFQERVTYLPGHTWPEKWLIERALSEPILSILSEFVGAHVSDLRIALESASAANKHDELRVLGSQLAKSDVSSALMRIVSMNSLNEFEEILGVLSSRLAP